MFQLLLAHQAQNGEVRPDELRLANPVLHDWFSSQHALFRKCKMEDAHKWYWERLRIDDVVPTPARKTMQNLEAISLFVADRGREPEVISSDPEESRLARVLARHRKSWRSGRSPQAIIDFLVASGIPANPVKQKRRPHALSPTKSTNAHND